MYEYVDWFVMQNSGHEEVGWGIKNLVQLAHHPVLNDGVGLT